MRIDTKTIAALVATCVLAVQPLVSLTVTETRKEFEDSAARELREYLTDEVPGAELGDWTRSVDETLFVLFRKTELHRGKLEARYVRTNSIVARIFPEGTVLLSTGLLDHIDVSLFDRMASSAKRVRSLEREREEALLPFLAPLAAEYAVDFGFAARNQAKPERGNVDRVTVALLALSGYETGVFESWLSGFARPGLAPALRDWASRFPAPAARLAALKESSGAIERLTAELASLESAATVGSEKRDILASAETVSALAGDIPYLRRLQALALHRAWLTAVSPREAPLVTHLPVASELDRSSETYLTYVSGMTAESARKTQTSFADAANVPGDAETFALALDSYRRAREVMRDFAFDSSYARLLFHDPSPRSRAEALGVASDAGEAEEISDSPVARANLAALLFYAGKDGARRLAGRFALPFSDAAKTVSVKKAVPSPSVPSGYPLDARSVSVNLALMMKAAGEAKKADEYLARVRLLFADARSVPSMTRASFRRLVPGDSVESLVSFWGKPAGIVYSYYSEWWEYPSLKARVLVETETGGREIARFVTVETGSPVSPGGNVRAGDPLADFEAEFGEAAYAAADSLVYLSGGTRFFVFAPFGTIRSMSAGF